MVVPPNILSRIRRSRVVRSSIRRSTVVRSSIRRSSSVRPIPKDSSIRRSTVVPQQYPPQHGGAQQYSPQHGGAQQYPPQHGGPQQYPPQHGGPQQYPPQQQYPAYPEGQQYPVQQQPEGPQQYPAYPDAPQQFPAQQQPAAQQHYPVQYGDQQQYPVQHGDPQQFPTQANEPPPSRPLTAQRSVFEPSTPAPKLAARPTPNLTPISPAGPTIPLPANGPMVPPGVGVLPSLPATNPLAPPPMVSSIATAPPEPTLHALKAAQLRNRRQQRKGKMFGRMLLVFAVLAALLATALTIGRPLLFPTDWDPSLTPIVDEVQQSVGVEFERTIPVVVQPAEAYAADLLAATIGTDWVDAVPTWRALGLAEGDVTAESVGAVLAERRVAFYDPVSGMIHQLEGRAPEELRPFLEVALLEALRHQVTLADGAPDAAQEPLEDSPAEATQVDTPPLTSEVAVFTGVTSRITLATRAVDAYLVQRTATDLFGVRPLTDTVAGVPIPIAYEFEAIDQLGEAVLVSAGVDVERVAFGDRSLDGRRDWLHDQPIIGLAPQLQADDRPVSAPVALGIDDWTLVWGSRLPAATVDELARIVAGDSYQPIVRNGGVCFAGVFQTTNEVAGSSLFTAMQQWVASSAAGSQAAASQLDLNTVQIEACDPGPAASTIPDPGAVDSLIVRQILRLTS